MLLKQTNINIILVIHQNIVCYYKPWSSININININLNLTILLL